MAGILANSASATMLAGATSADNSVSGYVSAEAITLSVTPAGTSWDWGLAKPSGSAARCELSDDDAASPVFTPDVAGYYTVTCVVDSTTTYVLRISVTQVAQTTSYEAIRLSPKLNSTVATPAVGWAVSASSDTSLPVAKNSAGTVRQMLARAFTPTSISDPAGAVGDIAYDDTYVYVKTSAGWKRAALGTF